MLHTKFCENRPAGSEDFSGFYHTWGWRPSWSCDLDFAITLIGQAVSEKIFKKCVWTTDRPRSRDDLDLY